MLDCLNTLTIYFSRIAAAPNIKQGLLLCKNTIYSRFQPEFSRTRNPDFSAIFYYPKPGSFSTTKPGY